MFHIEFPPSHLTQLDFSSKGSEGYPLEECIGPRSTFDLTQGYGKSSQSFYVKSIFQATLGLKSLLPDFSFEDALKYAGEQRNKIANATKTKNWDKFGRLRSENSYVDKISTPLVETYSSMLKELEKIPKSCPFMSWEQYSEETTTSFKVGFRTAKTFEGTVVKLSRYCLYGSESSTIAHTYPENLAEAKKQCNYLFNEIMRLDARDHKEYVQDLIAQLHWWLAQGTFYFRGSAACAEMIIAAITLYKFETLTPYKVGIFSDRIALVSSLDDFRSLYPSLRESAF